jgi:hypothetical protein
MNRALICFFTLAAAVCGAPSSRAEEFTRRSYTLPDGSFELTGEPARPKMIGIGFSDNNAGKPVYFAPHFYWGVTDSITLGITHDTGVCFTRDPCDRVYNDAGFGMLIALSKAHNHDVNFHFGAPIGSFYDPFILGVKVGVLARINAGILAFVFDPFLYSGITERDNGNRERLVLPFWLYFQPARFVAPFVGIAVEGPIDDFDDNYVIPVEGGVVFEVTNNVDLGAMLRFYNLLGKNGDGGGRELGVLARFRF